MNQTRADFIEGRIHQAFSDLAEEIAEGDSLTEENAAGVPFALFQAETALLQAWRSYVNGSEDLYGMISEYYELRGLTWPADADTAVDWLITEVGEVQELLLARRGKWVRNNPDAHPEYNGRLLEGELGDVILMALVAGMVEGLDPLAALAEKMRNG